MANKRFSASNCTVWIKLLGVLFAVFFPPFQGFLQAASELGFPRLSFDTITGIAIVNPSDQDAEVTLTVYGEDGFPVQATGFVNPVVITVEAGTQYSRVAAEIFQGTFDPGIVAWLQATSPVDGLTGFFLALDLPITYFDGADLPVRSRNIIFPEVCLGPDCSTEINVINPNPAENEIYVQVIGLQTVIEKEITLPKMGVFRLDVQALVDEVSAPSGALPESAYVLVQGTRPVGGFEFVRQADGDLLGLNAKKADELLNTIYFPQLAVRGLFQSRITVVNLSGEEALVTFRAFRPDGEPYDHNDLSNNPVTQLLASGEKASLDLETLFGFKGDETLQGWIQVDSTVKSINGVLTYSIPSIQSVAAVASQAQGVTSAVFSHIATTAGFFTGLAVLNPSSLPANVRIVAVRRDGTLLGSYTTVVAPRERISRLIHDLIGPAANQAGGFVVVRSSVPVLLTSLFGSLDSQILANVPPQPIPADFRPDAVVPQLRINPPLAVLAPGGALPFALQGGMGDVSWTVNGIPGGNAEVGTVTPGGSYQAPAMMPARLPVTIAGDVDGQKAAASVDVLSPEVLLSDLGFVRSVAYLEGLSRLYTAELSLGPAQVPAGGAQLGIWEVTGGNRQLLIGIQGDDVGQMLPFVGADRKEYLLFSGTLTGTIRRLDPATKALVSVATGLTSPSSLALDPFSGDLLVADGGQVLRFTAAALNSGLMPAAAQIPEPSAAPQGVADLAGDVQGLTVNPCTGNIVASNSEAGELVEIDRVTNEVRVLADVFASQLLTLVREGVSCPDSVHILGIDNFNSRVFLYTPGGEVIDWVEAPYANSLTRLPGENPFDSADAVLIGRAGETGGDILAVETPGIYQPVASNPPVVPPVVTDLLQFQFTANVVAADPFFGVESGTSITGRIRYSPAQAVRLADIPNGAFYSLGLVGNIELDVNGVTYNSNVNGDDEASLVVANNLSGSMGVIDQFQLIQGSAVFVLIDTSAGIFNSTNVPTGFGDGNVFTLSINTVVTFNSVDGLPHMITAHVLNIQPLN